MPIDLLAPLVAIPVVLLLAFAGCSLPPPSFSGLVLRWAGGLQTDIASIGVAFSLDPDSGEDPSNLHPMSTNLTGPTLNDFFVNGFDASHAAPWAAGSPGTLNCSCTITQTNTGKTAQLLASMSFDIDVPGLLVNFQLARAGTGFEQGDFSLTSAS